MSCRRVPQKLLRAMILANLALSADLLPAYQGTGEGIMLYQQNADCAVNTLFLAHLEEVATRPHCGALRRLRGCTVWGGGAGVTLVSRSTEARSPLFFGM